MPWEQWFCYKVRVSGQALVDGVLTPSDGMKADSACAVRGSDAYPAHGLWCLIWCPQWAIGAIDSGC